MARDTEPRRANGEVRHDGGNAPAYDAERETARYAEESYATGRGSDWGRSLVVGIVAVAVAALVAWGIAAWVSV